MNHWRTSCFTLVEVLLAVMILVVGLAGVLAAYAKTTDTLRIAQENVEAYALLKQKMGDVQMDYIVQGHLTAGASQGQFGNPPVFTWDLEASPGPVKTLDEVTVTISSSRTGRLYSLTSYFANDEKETSSP